MLPQIQAKRIDIQRQETQYAFHVAKAHWHNPKLPPTGFQSYRHKIITARFLVTIPFNHTVLPR